MINSQLSQGVILNEVKYLKGLRDSSPPAQNGINYSLNFCSTTLVGGPIPVDAGAGQQTYERIVS